jgi:hypothetical protein
MEMPGGTKREMKKRMTIEKMYDVAPSDRRCQFFASRRYKSKYDSFHCSHNAINSLQVYLLMAGIYRRQCVIVALNQIEMQKRVGAPRQTTG